MVKWTEENKLQMLLVIIEHLNPISLPWEKVSSAMGPEFSSESVRQQYKNIKKGFKSSTTTSSSTSASASTSPPTTKAKSTTTKGKKTTAASTNGTTKGRKRKAAEMTVAEDDEEDDSFMSPEASKTKTENGATGTMTEVFKAEPIGDGSIDLENDVLYSTA